MKSQTVNRVGERYLDLVRENPLRIIRSQEEYAHSIAMLDRLSARGIDRTLDETEYLLALALFVERFEQQHQPLPLPSGAARLQDLIQTHSLMKSDVASATGLSEATLTEILVGKRKLSRKHIQALAQFFKVESTVFMGE